MLRGYGAGNDVTAAGVFADLLRTLSWKLEFKMVKAYAPASSANMSVGFDVLGAAVTPVDGTLLGTTFRSRRRTASACKTLAALPAKLPSVPQGEHCLPVLGAFLPIGKSSGVDGAGKKYADWFRLGSSACSVVAALVAMNEFCGKPLNEMRMLALMGRWKGVFRQYPL